MDEIVQMSPSSFFMLGANILPLPAKTTSKTKKAPSLFQLEQTVFSKYALPDTSQFTEEDCFAEIAMGWSKEGIEFLIHVTTPSIRCFLLTSLRR